MTIKEALTDHAFSIVRQTGLAYHTSNKAGVIYLYDFDKTATIYPAATIIFYNHSVIVTDNRKNQEIIIEISYADPDYTTKLEETLQRFNP